MKSTDKTYYYWLDPIRALAALLVLFVHARSIMFDYYINLEPPSQNIFTQIFYFICSQGNISVVTFFILSGFLVGGINLERLVQKTITPKSFILNRIFRIGVPLTGAIALIILVDLLIDNPISIILILGQYLGLQFLVGDFGGVFWTLSYEIWFYLILFSAILIYSNNKNLLAGVILFTICCCVFVELEPKWFGVIAAGIIAYRLKDIRMPGYIQVSTFVLFSVCLMLYFFSNPTTNIAVFKTIDASWHLTIWMVCCWSLAVVISQLVHCKPVSKFSIWLDRYGRKLSAFSYSLFLTHYQLLKIYKHHFDKFTSVDAYSVMVFIGVCAACMFFAWLFYLLFERNTTTAKNWVIKKLN